VWGGAGLAVTANGLCHMDDGCAVLSKMKIINNRYPKFVLGYRMLSTKAPTSRQGGIALMWEENQPNFKVEAAKVAPPNVMTFLLITNDDQYFVMGG
jgi:hypothetical protein